MKFFRARARARAQQSGARNRSVEKGPITSTSTSTSTKNSQERRSATERARVTPTLHRAIYAAVRRIPRGKVATYGQIAAIVGKPRAARAVGRALRELPDALADRVPWQRVINAAGRCSERGGFWADRQRDRLEAEGVRIDRNGKVDLRQVAWTGPSAAELAQLRRAVAADERSERPDTSRSRWVPASKEKTRQRDLRIQNQGPRKGVGSPGGGLPTR